MAGKSETLVAALLPIGVVAAVAGCSGGGVTSSGAYVPPGSSSNRPMTTVQISLQFAARGTASTKRMGQALDANVQQVGVRFIPNPAPAVTPTEAIFNVPQPVPATTTLTVQAPVGADTFILGAYEQPTPCPVATGAPAKVRRPLQAATGLLPLNGSVQAVNLALNGANALSVSVGPVAFGADLFATSGHDGGYLGTTPSQWSPFENWTSAQQATVSETPVDNCDIALPSFVNSVVVSAPGSVALSPATVTAAGNIAATYPSATNVSGTIAAIGSLPVTSAPGTFSQSLTLLPDYYIFAEDGYGDFGVYDAQQGHQVSALTPAGKGRRPLRQRRHVLSGRRKAAAAQRRAGGQLRRSQSLADLDEDSSYYGMDATGAINCPGTITAAAVVVGYLNSSGYLSPSGAGIEVITVSGSPSTTPGSPGSDSALYNFLPWIGSDNPLITAFDPSTCRAYAGDDLGDLGVVTGIANGAPSASLSAISGSPFSTAVYSGMAAANGTFYAADWDISGLYTWPLSAVSGSPTVNSPSVVAPSLANDVSFYSNPGLVLAGGKVYAQYESVSTGNCMFSALDGSSGPLTVPTGFAQLTGTLNGGIYGADWNSELEAISTPLGAAPVIISSSPEGYCFYGVAASKDTQGTTLWAVDFNGVCYAYQLPITSTSPTSFTSFSPAGLPGDIYPEGIAIAP
jgi:hypothetical protein